jgi:hypothetical protein
MHFPPLASITRLLCTQDKENNLSNVRTFCGRQEYFLLTTWSAFSWPTPASLFARAAGECRLDSTCRWSWGQRQLKISHSHITKPGQIFSHLQTILTYRVHLTTLGARKHIFRLTVFAKYVFPLTYWQCGQTSTWCLCLHHSVKGEDRKCAV